jgi:hypothetical protein
VNGVFCALSIIILMKPLSTASQIFLNLNH